MGQKINPTGFRLPVTHDWTSRWYATGRDFARTLAEDLKVRDYLGKKLKNASVGRILIERPAKNARITIFSARPGVVIGKKGEDIEVLKAELQKLMGVPVHVNIKRSAVLTSMLSSSPTASLSSSKNVLCSARYEACHAERNASGRSWYQDHVLRPFERCRNCPY